MTFHDFIDKLIFRFLAANSITAEDWIKIQKEDKKMYDDMIDQFSYVVLEKSLLNV